MVSPFIIPLTPVKQRLAITLNGTQYQLTLKWNNKAELWMIDLSDENGSPLIGSIPLVTGIDLLRQYAYLEIGGQLVVQTTNDTLAVPTDTNLGDTSNLFYIAPDV